MNTRTTGGAVVPTAQSATEEAINDVATVVHLVTVLGVEAHHTAVAEYGARRNAVYLVENGVDPHEAVRRVVVHNRKWEVYYRAIGLPFGLLYVLFFYVLVSPTFPLFDLYSTRPTLTGQEAVHHILFALMIVPFGLAVIVAAMAVLLIYPARIRKELYRGIPEWDRKSTLRTIVAISFGRSRMKEWMKHPAARWSDIWVVRLARGLLLLVPGLIIGGMLLGATISLVQRHSPCGTSITYRPSASCPPFRLSGD